MDSKRSEKLAYEYLCHLEEAKKWLESCLGETLPDTGHLEEALRNGVYLAKLAHRFAPDQVPLKRIYDVDQVRYGRSGLTFRHTDNINHWLRVMPALGFPAIFLPETTDLYDRKNMPRVVYCIHAFSLFLHSMGKAPQMPDLYGKAEFSDDILRAMALQLQAYGAPLPQFSKIGGILAKEMPVGEAEHHAAIIAVNHATELHDADQLLDAMRIPAAKLERVDGALVDFYLQVVMLDYYLFFNLVKFT